jgi:hypothetical protein
MRWELLQPEYSDLDICRDDSVSSTSRHFDMIDDGSSTIAHWQDALASRVTSQLSRVGASRSETPASENSVTQFAVQNLHQALAIKGRSSTTAPRYTTSIPLLEQRLQKHYSKQPPTTTTTPQSWLSAQHSKTPTSKRLCPASSRFFTKKLYADSSCATRVGVFATLTNSYALVAVGASENFYR